MKPSLSFIPKFPTDKRQQLRDAADDAVCEYLAARKDDKGLYWQRERVAKCAAAMVDAVKALTGAPIHDVRDGFILDGVTIASGMGWELNQRRSREHVLFVF